MSKVDFSHIPLPHRLFYVSVLFLVLIYPGHNELQRLILHPGLTRTYVLGDYALSEYPINDGKAAPAISARAAIIQDVNSKVIIFSQNPNERLMAASTTKIMTALVALDYYNLSDIITIRVEDRAIGSTMNLVRGEQISVENLLYGLLVHSGNDAALALAENYPGGYDGFVRAMNKKATELNLDHTTYQNPSGIDSYGHVTTARDLAVLAAIAVKNPVISKIMQTKQITITDATGTIPHMLENTNKLLGILNGVKGLKTGWTELAGECLVTYVERDNHPIISVVLGSSDRFGDTTRLIDWVYAHHSWQLPELKL